MSHSTRKIILGITLLLAFIALLFTGAHRADAAALIVPQGGTGAGSFTSECLLKGSGTAPFRCVAAGVNGQALQLIAGVPTWAAIAESFSETLANAWLATKTTDDLDEGLTRLYYQDARARSAISESVTGLDYSTSTGAFTTTSGYGIPTTAKQTDWDTAFGWGNHASAGYLVNGSQWTKNGTDLYYAGGNVGVGTSNPLVKLDTRAPASSVSMTLGSSTGIGFGVQSAGGSFGWYSGVNNSTGNSWIQAGRVDSAVAYDLGLQASGGNVGIGTVSPGAKLNVSSTAAGAGSDGLVVGQTDSVAGVNHNSRLYTQQVGGGIARTLFYAASNTTGDTQGQFDILTENGANFLMQLGSNDTGTNKLSLYSLAGSETVRLNTNGSSYFTGGNVGIGTTPSYILDIQDSGAGFRYRGAVNSFRVQDYTVSTAYGPQVVTDNDRIVLPTNVYFGDSATFFARESNMLRLQGDGGLRFTYYDGVSSIEEAMRITGGVGGGNVGIGTTTPGQKLTVSGSLGLPTLSDGCLELSSGVVTSTGSVCGSGGGGSITSLGGQTGSSQTFATSTSGGLNLSIGSAGDVHTFTLAPAAGYNIPLTASTTDWTTAFGWGNHASAGYLTGNQSITLSGDISGTGSTAITTTIGALKVVNSMIANATIDLTAKVTGILPPANGGTGLSTYTTGDILYSSATNVLSKLGIGTDTQVLTVSGGVPTWADAASGGGSPPEVVTFTSSGTWTKDAGLKYIEVELVGGGASGGSGPNTSSGPGGDGGAGAGYSRKIILAADLASTETVTIGAGAAPSGATGGTTSFGSHLQATGGNGTGDGGVGSGGDLNTAGGSSKRGQNEVGAGGEGGDSHLGGGGKGSPSYNTAPSNGQGYGGGGGGRAARNGSNGQAGGSGKEGIVIITEHY